MRDDKPPSSEVAFPWSAGEENELRFSLLCEGHIIRLNPGTFTLGRSSNCEIVVDDMLASREHARLLVFKTEIVLEDLNSTNGLYLNGSRVEGRVSLKAGDMIVIGTQELQVGALPVNPDTTQPSFPTSAPSLTDLDEPMPSSETLKPPTKMSTDEHAGTERADTFQTIEPVVTRLLAEGRIDAVERLLMSLVGALRDGARKGQPVPPDTLEVSSNMMVQIAEATLDPYWVDSIIDIYTCVKQPLPGPVIVRLSSLLTGFVAANRDLQREYARVLSQIRQSLPLTDQILVERTLAILASDKT